MRLNRALAPLGVTTDPSLRGRPDTTPEGVESVSNLITAPNCPLRRDGPPMDSGVGLYPVPSYTSSNPHIKGLRRTSFTGAGATILCSHGHEFRGFGVRSETEFCQGCHKDTPDRCEHV
jgi:hypothetical protein